MKKFLNIGSISSFILVFAIIFSFSIVSSDALDTKSLNKELKSEKVSENYFIKSSRLSTNNLNSRSSYLDLTLYGEFEDVSKYQVLNELNRIRKEACDEGIDGLKPDDYVPLKWSVSLEGISTIRSAEASINTSHISPNGEYFDTVVMDGESSSAENLAWNSDSNITMRAISQYYEEKKNLIDNNGKETGHYKAIIKPEYRTVGTASFRAEPELIESKAEGCNAMEFSPKLLIDGDFGYDNDYIPIDVAYRYLVMIGEEIAMPDVIPVGDIVDLDVPAVFDFPKTSDTVYEVRVGGTLNQCIDWSVSDENIVLISRDTKIKPE